MKNWYILFIYFVAMIIFLIYNNEIIDWLQHGQAPLSLIVLIAVMFIVFPVIPYKIVIGALGYMYGSLLGALISWVAASIGSVIIYLLVRLFFQKQARAYLSKFDRLEKLQRTFEQNPFITLLIARMIPIMPQSLVNVYSGLISIPLVTYTLASALGKIPAMLIYAFIGKHLFSDMHLLLMGIGIYVLFLIVTYLIYRLWVRR